MQDIKPVALCITTQDLFDTRRFILNFCDGLIMRGEDVRLKNALVALKRDMNAFRTQKNFLDGYKAIITSNIDKIIGTVANRYAGTDIGEVEGIMRNGNELMKKVLKAESFDEIGALEAEFKSKITLPTYRLFIDDLKKSNIKIV